jgi:hypothetical protein
MTEKRIYWLAAICLLLTSLAFVIPRFVETREGGYASAGMAVLVFLGVLALAAVVSLYLLVLTLGAYRRLTFLPRLAGIAPAVILVTALAVLVGWLRY